MKIIQIADCKIFGLSGGSIEERKYYFGLKQFAGQHGHEFRVVALDEALKDSFYIRPVKNRIIDLLVRCMGHSTYVYYNWLRMRKAIIAYKPDVVVLGRSRMGVVARDIKKKLPKCRVICNFSNIEVDYVDGYFAKARGIAKKLYIAWEKSCVRRDEGMAVQWADHLNYLTQRDKNRANELYPRSIGKKDMILPICIHSSTELIRDEGKNVAFVGSLGYQSNVEAITEFIEKVWEPYYADQDDTHLIIAGSKPGEALKTRLSAIPNCKMYQNFRWLEDIIPRNTLMIAPILHGAGMKVKVAETLSMGLMIAASDEALVGYEAAISHDKLQGIIRANTVDEYVNAIRLYCSKTDEELREIACQNKNLYADHYSYEVSQQAISKLLENT